MSTKTTAVPAEEKVATVSAWKKAKSHRVRLYSGVYVYIQIPDLPKLIESGALPQPLLDVALGTSPGIGDDEAPTVESFEQQRKFTDFMVKESVVEPKLTDEDIAEIPFEDKILITEIATRQRDFDAEYNHIGGLNTSKSFRQFRGLGEFDPDVEGL